VRAREPGPVLELVGLRKHFPIHAGILRRAVGRVRELLDLVGLPASARTRFPHAFSGGQRQRIGIARALALNPKPVVADEPVSALDASVQAEIVNLLLDVQDRLGVTMLFVAHDLSVVKHVSDRVAVIYVGRLVEVASTADIYASPLHPYTEALLAAAPKPDPALRGERPVLVGEVADPAWPPPGCVFHPRCPTPWLAAARRHRSSCPSKAGEPLPATVPASSISRAWADGRPLSCAQTFGRLNEVKKVKVGCSGLAMGAALLLGSGAAVAAASPAGPSGGAHGRAGDGPDRHRSHRLAQDLPGSPRCWPSWSRPASCRL